jgi:hypothetical protein
VVLNSDLSLYVDNGIPHTTGIYRRTLDAVRASGAQYLNATLLGRSRTQ